MAFEKGERVYLNHPFVPEGTTGVIQEVTQLPTENEYTILVEGESRPRIFGEHSLISESLFQMEE